MRDETAERVRQLVRLPATAVHRAVRRRRHGVGRLSRSAPRTTSAWSASSSTRSARRCIQLCGTRARSTTTSCAASSASSTSRTRGSRSDVTGTRDPSRRSCDRVRSIPEGFVTTYGDLCPEAPRRAGAVMAPCEDPERALAPRRPRRRLARGRRAPARACSRPRACRSAGDRVDLRRRVVRRRRGLRLAPRAGGPGADALRADQAQRLRRGVSASVAIQRSASRPGLGWSLPEAEQRHAAPRRRRSGRAPARAPESPRDDHVDAVARIGAAGRQRAGAGDRDLDRGRASRRTAACPRPARPSTARRTP